jgi:hypothetical protein
MKEKSAHERILNNKPVLPTAPELYVTCKIKLWKIFNLFKKKKNGKL